MMWDIETDSRYDEFCDKLEDAKKNNSILEVKNIIEEIYAEMDNLKKEKEYIIYSNTLGIGDMDDDTFDVVDNIDFERSSLFSLSLNAKGYLVTRNK